MSEKPSPPKVDQPGKKHGMPLGPVPVFNCIVNLSPAGQGGAVRAQVANLPEIVIEAPTEREVLQRVVAEFKRIVGGRHAAGEPIGWTDPALPPEADQQQRLIAVHL
jgi:hypothetical protein